MPPKRKTATKVETTKEAPPSKRSKKAEPEPEPPKRSAKGKKAEPAAKPKATATKGKKKCDPEEFVRTLLECCKVLMTVCETRTVESDEEMTITTVEDFHAHGAAILELLPEEARMPMMKIALIYQEELDEDPPFDIDDLDDQEDGDGEEGEEEEEDDDEAEEDDGDDDDDDDDDGDDLMRPEHFYHFKKFFSEADAAKLVASAEDGGELSLAIQAALDSLFNAYEEEEEDEDEDDDAPPEDDDDWTDPNVAWKK